MHSKRLGESEIVTVLGRPVLVRPALRVALGPDDTHPESQITGQDYVGAYYRIGDTIPEIVRTYLASSLNPTRHTSVLLAGGNEE